MVESVSSSGIIDNYIRQQSQIAAIDQQTQKNANLTKLTGDYDTFLKLLTAQMQYQDPLAPTDASEYTKQLVTFSQVEQSIAANDKLDQLIKLNQATGISPMLDYIGRFVEAATGDNISLQDGKVQVAYALKDVATDLTIVIKDKNGIEVNRLDGAGTVGAHRVTWDGKKADGTQLPDGAYKFEIIAKDGAGKDVNPTAVTTISKVTGVAVGQYGGEIASGELVVLERQILSVQSATSVDG